MSILLFILTVLCITYTGQFRLFSKVLLVALSVVGMYLDRWNFFSVIGTGALLALAFLITQPSGIRRTKISTPLLGWVRELLPKLSSTEQEALNSGTVDWDGELFSGRPNWRALLERHSSVLTEEEKAFLEGPVHAFCLMLDDWKITYEDYDLSQEAWQFLKTNGFFGLVIPKDAGGKGFSAMAHSEIVMKISTRSITAAVTVMVPNSLGPSELLMHYGTQAQQEYYLPRLAEGKEIPCFALTSPVAGSDAGAIPDKGVVCKGQWKGKEVIGLSVTWNKRYITLAPVATLIGLAIKVYDPNHLLGNDTEIGVTCVLIPHDIEGVHSGDRHLPMNTAFMNGPTWGEDVFIPMELVIGGRDMLGNGWKMLMECLSIGRSISLPALGAGAGKFACLTAGSYSAVREQFGRSISHFEGVQEALEKIAGYTYMMDAARIFTAQMVDRGVRPSVPSALLKFRNTDLMRVVVNSAMDIVAGRGVISGPRNFMANAYQAVPIGITVEGANILTRSLMIFGQGAIRCHPFIVEEIEAANTENHNEAIQKFDNVFFRHVGSTLSNALRSFVLGMTGGRLGSAPRAGGIAYYYRQLNRFAASFSVLTDCILLTIGGGLKARQRISGRMADCLTALYYASSVIKHWHNAGYDESQRSLVEWCLQTCLYDLQEKMNEVINNYPNRLLRWPLRVLVFPLGLGGMKRPDDHLGRNVADSIVIDGPLREAIIKGCFVNKDPSDPVGRVLNAYQLANDTKPIREKLHKAIHSRDVDDLEDIAMLMGHQRKKLVEWAVKEKIVEEKEAVHLEHALSVLYDVIRVDTFQGDTIESLAKNSLGVRRLSERPNDRWSLKGTS